MDFYSMPRILKIKRGLTRSAFRHSAVGSKKKTVSVKHLINGQLVSTGQVKQITTQKGPTQHKQDVLKELSRRYLMLRRGYLLRFYPTAMIEKVLGSSDQLVKENCPDFLSVEMLTHYHKMAMEEAIAIARAGWEQDFVEVKQLIYHNPRWNNLERNELCYLLAAPGLISKIILGQVIEAPKPEWQINDQRVLCAYLKRLVLKHRASFPHHERQKRALVIDNRLYDLFTRPEDKFFKGCWLRISTFPNEKRICIPLAGKDLGNLNGKTRKNLRVILEPDGRILFTIPYEISIPRVVKTKEKLNIEEAKKELLVDPTLEVVAIDKGMVNTIIANATDDPTQAEFYGDGGLPKKVSDKQEAKLKNRQRLQAYARELVKSEKPEDWAKAGRIQLNNLGKVKQTHQNTRDKASVTRLINQSANQLFQAHPQMRVLV
jgi:hypothetical protein